MNANELRDKLNEVFEAKTRGNAVSNYAIVSEILWRTVGYVLAMSQSDIPAEREVAKIILQQMIDCCANSTHGNKLDKEVK